MTESRDEYGGAANYITGSNLENPIDSMYGFLHEGWRAKMKPRFQTTSSHVNLGITWIVTQASNATGYLFWV